MPSLEQFRKQVVRRSLFSPRSLSDALNQLGFVQADPIRCPARAQDLILRHRVRNYKAGDLERSYPKLDLEECYLYAYGFLSKNLWRIIHPTTDQALTLSQKKALEVIERLGPVSPKDFETQVGGERARNYWGGYSRSAKLELEELHECGVLRIARRIKGNRIYETAESFEQRMSKSERFKAIIIATLKAMGATTRKFLMSELAHFRNLIESAPDRRACLQELIDSGRIRVDIIDAVEYIRLEEEKAARGPLNSVRLLAPFDPIVRDRTRLEHLWNWTYRFEAYTPKAKRKLGYYAMPVLWRDRIIGWANASVKNAQLTVEFGYATKRPQEQAYRQSAQKEIADLANFLGLDEGCWKASI